jgi:hypothetical protein
VLMCDTTAHINLEDILNLKLPSVAFRRIRREL